MRGGTEGRELNLRFAGGAETCMFDDVVMTVGGGSPATPGTLIYGK